MRFIVYVSLVLCASSSAFAQDVFTANKRSPSNLQEVWELVITSRADELRIDGVSANRGNCDLKPRLPIILRFGETAHLGVARCDPIELTIKTQIGEFSTHWDQDLYVDNGFTAKKSSMLKHWILFVTNVGEPAEVTSFKVNKGNCSRNNRIAFPETPDWSDKLDFGDRYGAILLSCNPLSLTITTNRGESTFLWDN